MQPSDGLQSNLCNFIILFHPTGHVPFRGLRQQPRLPRAHEVFGQHQRQRRRRLHRMDGRHHLRQAHRRDHHLAVADRGKDTKEWSANKSIHGHSSIGIDFLCLSLPTRFSMVYILIHLNLTILVQPLTHRRAPKGNELCTFYSTYTVDPRVNV